MHLERLKPYSNTCFYHDLDMRHTKTLTGTKKTLDAPNLHRHKKKLATIRCIQWFGVFFGGPVQVW